ncbi:hypothetical protein BKH41_06315 [Helicobacter sp. 12S02232-10]|uniref:hypothetical protein n=1 Tax=Helicobacter sp. 12S02232-10 TaxID=1476197 RepID=UPI000BA6367A|nr:hypothetical protein [Helicobacter sp. 12S02232-10]PAF48323.1 hypothetical protein BKH41_06315 [Helicobacter sp. 12S02232-10]
MKYFYGLILVLTLLSGCMSNGDHKNQVKYTFSDQNGQTFKIQSDFDTFNIRTQKSEKNDKVTLIMFLDLESQNCKDYILNIDHLKLTFPRASILGILIKPYSQEQISLYAKENNVDFPLLNPTDSKNIFEDFSHKINPPQEEQNTSLEIPYFVLYNKHGKRYQTYSGIVMEEMFAYDIDALLKMH